MVVKRFQNVLIRCVVHFVFMLVNKSVNKWVFPIYLHFTHLFTLKKLIILSATKENCLFTKQILWFAYLKITFCKSAI